MEHHIYPLEVKFGNPGDRWFSQQHSQVGEPLHFSEKATEVQREVGAAQSWHSASAEPFQVGGVGEGPSRPSTIQPGPRTKPGAEHVVIGTWLLARIVVIFLLSSPWLTDARHWAGHWAHRDTAPVVRVLLLAGREDGEHVGSYI